MNTAHNPYVGPRPFSRDEKLYGRDHEALELADLLISERIVLLYSPSGAGKTSLIEARLKPVLEEEGFRILPTLRVGQHGGNGASRPSAQNRYVLNALSTLAEELGRPESAERLAERTFASYLTELEGLSNGKPPGTPRYELLIFDQFEEVFTTGSLDLEAEKERRTFFWEIGEALRPRHRWALFAMREDYIARLDPYAHSIPTRFANTFRLDLLRRPNAAAAIQGPAADNGIEITDEAVDSLITDLSKVRSNGVGGVREHVGLHVEPVQLQVVCHRLWQRLESSGELTKTHRIDEGQVADTVADIDKTLGDYYAETVRDVAGRTGTDERTLRAWFESRLITSGGIRKQVQDGPASADAGVEALRALVDAFLVRSVSRGGVTWYELAHDRLVQPVRNDNARWEKENLSLLQRSSEDWNRKKRTEDLLLRGDALQEEERWAAANQDRLSATDREFLEACLKARHESRRAKRLKTLLAAVAAVALLAMTFLYWKAEAARRDAREAQAEAEEAARTARGTQLTYLPHALLLEAQKALRRQDDSLSALLALLAYHFREDFRQPDLDARYGDATLVADRLIDGKSVHDALAQVVARPYFGHFLEGHQRAVRTVAFSPDGTLLASGGADGKIFLWRLRKPFQPVASLEAPEVRSVAFSPDGRWLVSGGADGKVLMWRLEKPFQTVASLEAPNEVRSVAFSPDGRWLAAGLALEPQEEDAAAVRLWPVQDGVVEPAVDLTHYRSGVRTVLFHPTASPPMLVSAADDKKLRFWQLGPVGWHDLPSWISPAELDGKIGGIAFSPAGDRWGRGLAVARTVAWAPGEKAEPDMTLFELEGQVKRWTIDSEVRSLAYVGTDLLVGSTSTGEVVLWDLLHDGHNPTVLSGQRSWVSQVAGDPQGRFVASAGSDKRVHLWERLDPKIRGESRTAGDQVHAIAISPKENLSDRWVAAGLENGEVELYPLGSGGSLGEPRRLPRLPSEAGGGVRTLFFDPSGVWLAAIGAEETVRVWDLKRPESAPQQILPSWVAAWKLPEPALADSEGKILSWAPSNGPRWLAAAIGGERQPWMQEGRVRVWDRAEPGEAGFDLPIENSSGEVVSLGEKTFSSVAWNGDNRLAAGNWDGKVRIWDLASEGPQAPPEALVSGYSGVVSVAWSGDGRLLASGHSLGTVLVWETTAKDAEPIVFKGHEKKVYALAFGDNDEVLYSGGQDGTLRTWKLTGVLADEVCRIAGRGLSEEEWERFVGPDVEAHRGPACPRTQK